MSLYLSVYRHLLAVALSSLIDRLTPYKKNSKSHLTNTLKLLKIWYKALSLVASNAKRHGLHTSLIKD